MRDYARKPAPVAMALNCTEVEEVATVSVRCACNGSGRSRSGPSANSGTSAVHIMAVVIAIVETLRDDVFQIRQDKRCRDCSGREHRTDRHDLGVDGPSFALDQAGGTPVLCQAPSLAIISPLRTAALSAV